MALFVLFSVFPVTSGEEGPAWPMFGGDHRHTSQSSHDTSNNLGGLSWKFSFNGSVGGSPAIGSDGTIYFGSSGGSLYAVDPMGSLRWKYMVDTPIPSSPAIGPDGTIYFSASSLDYGAPERVANNSLYALNPDGALKWRYRTGAISHAGPTVGPDGTIYACTSSNNDLSFSPGLMAFDPNGTMLWWARSDGGALSAPAVGPDGSIYFISEEGRLNSVAPDGNVSWVWSVPPSHLKYYREGASPAIATDGTVYFGSGGNYLYAIPTIPDLSRIGENGSRSGVPKWQFETSGHVTAPAIGNDGTIYVGSFGGTLGAEQYLYAINSDGNLKWKFPARTGIGAPSLGQDGTIFACGQDGYLYAINPDGSLRWKYGTIQQVAHDQGPPSIGPNGTVYVAGDGLYAIGTGSPGVVEGLSGRWEWGKVILKWSPPASDGGSAVSSYRIWRGNHDRDLTLLTSVDPSVTTFEDVNATGNRYYTYTVQAVNGHGEGPESIVRVDPNTPYRQEKFISAFLPLILIGAPLLALEAVCWKRQRRIKKSRQDNPFIRRGRR